MCVRFVAEQEMAEKTLDKKPSGRYVYTYGLAVYSLQNRQLCRIAPFLRTAIKRVHASEARAGQSLSDF